MESEFFWFGLFFWAACVMCHLHFNEMKSQRAIKTAPPGPA